MDKMSRVSTSMASKPKEIVAPARRTKSTGSLAVMARQKDASRKPSRSPTRRTSSSPKRNSSSSKSPKRVRQEKRVAAEVRTTMLSKNASLRMLGVMPSKHSNDADGLFVR